MSQLEELHAAYIGHRVMAAMMSARATMARGLMNGSAARLTAEEEEPSVEVVVWGDTDDDPGGGTDNPPKESIRRQIRQVKDSISETEKQIAGNEADLKTRGCL